jgi:hypothetical protein
MIEETNEERALADDLTAYVNDKHTQEECIGFIDGYKAALAKLKNLRLGVVVGQGEQLQCGYCLSILKSQVSRDSGFCDSYCLERNEAL